MNYKSLDSISEASAYGPFPDPILEEIKSYPGNDKCCDCQSIDTDWGDVSHGILICLECAGKHRALGVQVSFVRSIYMDTWSVNQIAMMKYGGNGRIQAYFNKMNMSASAINILYSSQVASSYRQRLKEKVDLIVQTSLHDIYKNLCIQKAHSTNEIISAVDEPVSKTEKMYVNCVFERGPMGMTLTRDRNGNASVSRLYENGPAIIKGVNIGDKIVKIMGQDISKYDEVVHLILTSMRPIKVTFSRKSKHSVSGLNISSTDEFNTSVVSSSSIFTPINNNTSSSPIAFEVSSSSSASANLKESIALSPIRTVRSPSPTPTNSLSCNKIKSKLIYSYDGDIINSFSDDSYVSDVLASKSNDFEIEYNSYNDTTDVVDNDNINTSLHPYIRVGMEVKVLRNGKWRSGIITSINQDCTKFQVIYFKDRSVERDVSIERLGFHFDISQEIRDIKGKLSLTPKTKRENLFSMSSLRKSLSNSLDDDLSIEIDETIAVGPITPIASQQKLKKNSKDIRITFVSRPFGMTLSKARNNAAEITNIKINGRAFQYGVQVGDFVVGINSVWLNDYDDAIKVLESSKIPLDIVFRRYETESF